MGESGLAMADESGIKWVQVGVCFMSGDYFTIVLVKWFEEKKTSQIPAEMRELLTIIWKWLFKKNLLHRNKSFLPCIYIILDFNGWIRELEEKVYIFLEWHALWGNTRTGRIKN